MQDFPEFMKNPKNRVSDKDQHTRGVEGYYFDGADGSQMAYWICHVNGSSASHTHQFDEYMICVAGQYTLIMNEKEIVLRPGDEFFIPKGTLHGGKVTVGTRTIHAFGGKRIQNKK